MSYGKKLITVKQAAEILGLPESTVRNRKGGTAKLTRVKMGRAIRMLLGEVEAHRDRLIAAAQKYSKHF